MDMTSSPDRVDTSLGGAVDQEVDHPAGHLWWEIPTAPVPVESGHDQEGEDVPLENRKQHLPGVAERHDRLGDHLQQIELKFDLVPTSHVGVGSTVRRL